MTIAEGERRRGSDFYNPLVYERHSSLVKRFEIKYSAQEVNEDRSLVRSST